DIVPILPGTSSWVLTTVSEKLDISNMPIIQRTTMASHSLTKGSNIVKGAGPTSEHKIIFRLPNRSAKGPPKKVPTAPANKKEKIYNCAWEMDKPYVSMA